MCVMCGHEEQEQRWLHMWVMTWYSSASNVRFQLGSRFSSTSSVSASSSPVYTDCSFTLVRFGRWVPGIGEELRYSSKDLAIVKAAAGVTDRRECAAQTPSVHLRKTVSEEEWNITISGEEWNTIIILIAIGGACLLVHLPTCCSFISLVNGERNASYVQYMNSHTHPAHPPAQKYSCSHFIDIKAVLYTKELESSKFSAKFFFFKQIKLCRETSTYDLSRAVHSNKDSFPRNICSGMSGGRARSPAWIVRDVATQTIIEVFNLVWQEILSWKFYEIFILPARMWILSTQK